jgi:hypothetical protein
MKKRLLLLPLLGGLVLSGCTWEDLMFWKKKDGTSSKDYFEFVVADMDTPYFGEDPATPQEFTYEGITFLDREAYYASSKDCLWFYNQWSGNLTDDKATEDTVFAFIANQTAFSKGISKIEVTTTAGTGGPQLHVAFGSSAFSESQAVSNWVKINASTESTYTVTGDGSSKYFCISPRGDVGYKPKNLQVSSIKVYFGK